MAHLVAVASEGVGGVEEARVRRDVVLGAVEEREGELSVAARRDAAAPRRRPPQCLRGIKHFSHISDANI